jgi:serine/threonine-protein kinase
MGEVYRADDLKLGQTVALKFLPRHLQRDPRRLNRLLNEVRLARQVSHPNVCRVYDVDETEGQHFLTMEHVDGEDLESLLRRIGRLPGDKGVEVGRQLCAGLAAVHDQGILHRDLKPANVMIDGRGRARITDFGLASLADHIDDSDVIAGTPAYMAPEQLAGKECTVASDLYALGLVLYEVFTGRRVFSGNAREDIARQQAGSILANPSNLVNDLDPAVEHVIDRCLEMDPKARPRSALGVGAALPGGDPLAAMLSAGETPSPEMIAATGAAQALQPARALLLGLAALGIFVAGISLTGRFGIHGYLPLDKPPEVLVDRAQAIVRELGYTEPAYARPADTALGYSFDGDEYERIRADRDPERLRDPSGSAVSFWYRQSPRELEPESGARVSLWDPFPKTTGELLVSLGMDGSLETFVAVPRRYRDTPDSTTEIDWAPPFELAGLEMADYERDEPRYQQFVHSQQLAAWVPRDSTVWHRIEAGANEGKLSLFAILDRKTAERLAAGPGEVSSSGLDVLSTTFLIVLIVSAFMARVNMRRGRADVRSAVRLGVFTASLQVVSTTLVSHPLLNPKAVADAIFTGVLSTLVYLAMEPHVRRIWPTILISWSRLIGRSASGTRDPLVGRAILAGVLVGASVLLLPVLGLAMFASREGVPGFFDLRGIHGLPGQREAWSLVLERVTWAVIEGLSLTFLMVIARLVLRRPTPSAVLAAMLWFVPDIGSMLTSGGAPAFLMLEAAFLLTAVTVMMLVLLRWGLVGVIAMSLTTYLGALAPTSDWSAWHAQPGIVCTLLIAMLAGYGCWAATAGHRYRAILAGPRS